MKYTLRIPLLFSTALMLSASNSNASPPFAEGNLAVAFYSVTGSGASAVFGTTYYVVNLGPANLYRENTLNNVSVSTINPDLASSNISADLTAVFGSNWANDGTVRWIIVGSVSDTGLLTNGDPARTIYLSAPRTILNSNQTGPDSATNFPATISSANRTGSCGAITTFLEGATQAIKNTNGYTSIPGSNGAGVRMTTSNQKSLDEYISPTTPGLYFTLGNNPTQTFSSGALAGNADVQGALDIFRVIHTITNADLTAGASNGNAVVGARQYIGALTIDSAGTLKIAGVGSAGSYSTWASTNNVTGGANGDSDNDGISNLTEYALLLNPAGSDGASGTYTGGTITFTKRAESVTNNDVTYAIQESADLGLTDAWHDVTPTTNTMTSITYTLPPGSPKKFARLVVKTIP